jgi:hypothetical protein
VLVHLVHGDQGDFDVLPILAAIAAAGKQAGDQAGSAQDGKQFLHGFSSF